MTHRARCQYNFNGLQGAKVVNASLGALSKPIRTVMRWQLLATAILTLLAVMLGDAHSAWSTGLGGAISVCAGWASGFVAATGKGESAGGVLVTALMAEGVKLGVMACLLGMVLVVYTEVVVAVFLGAFILTALIFSMAFFVREHNQPRT